MDYDLIEFVVDAVANAPYGKFRGRRKQRSQKRVQRRGKARGFAKTRRRPYNRSKQYTQSNSRVNRRRAQLALPPVALGKVTMDTAKTQWAALTSSLWSFKLHYDGIAKGDARYSRSSEIVKILPWRHIMKINQAADHEAEYRIMLMRFPENGTAEPTPTGIFENFSATDFRALRYKEKEERTYPFIVLWDKSFTWSTYDGRKTSRWVKIGNRKASNITYDSGIASGLTGMNKVTLVVMTTATAVTVGYEYKYTGQIKFLDD